jgi:hypothetical protein
MEKKCINCESRFECKSSKAKYCSNKCKNAYKYKNYKNHSFLCKECGKENHSYRNDLEFCNKKCAKIYLSEKPECTIEIIIEEIIKNPQISIKQLSLLLKTSLRNIYYRIEKSGYSSYKELIGVVKGVYIEKQRSDTSIASINCLNYIKEILKEEYESEVVFEGLFNPLTKKSLRVDGYFRKKGIVVEYQGIQHYKVIPYFHKGKNTLEYQQFKDQLKKDYFEQHNIKYICIPYWYTKKDIYAETIKSEAEDTSSERLETT